MELAVPEDGARVLTASCFDPRFPPANVLEDESVGDYDDDKDNEEVDSKLGACWITTGMFPQDLVLQLSQPGIVTKLNLRVSNAQDITVHRCVSMPTSSAAPTRWEPLTDYSVSSGQDGQAQDIVLDDMVDESIASAFLKISINSGFEPFVALHHVSVTGRQARRK